MVITTNARSVLNISINRTNKIYYSSEAVFETIIIIIKCFGVGFLLGRFIFYMCLVHIWAFLWKNVKLLKFEINFEFRKCKKKIKYQLINLFYCVLYVADIFYNFESFSFSKLSFIFNFEVNFKIPKLMV